MYNLKYVCDPHLRIVLFIQKKNESIVALKILLD